MIQLIMQENYGTFTSELIEMHRLRYRVFKGRLDWDVHVSGDMEMDIFDTLCPAYLLQRSEDGQIQGCVRLLPSTGPTMLRDTFSILLAGQPAPASPAIWESSRFSLDIVPNAPKAASGLAIATFELFAGVIEFGISQRLTNIVTVTDVRMERILRRATWPLRRIAEPIRLGTTLALAGYLDISDDALACVRKAGDLQGPLLSTSGTLAAACDLALK